MGSKRSNNYVVIETMRMSAVGHPFPTHTV